MSGFGKRQGLPESPEELAALEEEWMERYLPEAEEMYEQLMNSGKLKTAEDVLFAGIRQGLRVSIREVAMLYDIDSPQREYFLRLAIDLEDDETADRYIREEINRFKRFS